MIRGDIIFVKGRGFTFRVLSFLLSIFDSNWRKLKDKFWHTGIAFQHSSYGGWFILEARGGGVSLNIYEEDWLKENTRSVTWLDQYPTKKQMAKLLIDYNGKPYDIAIYFWSSLAVIFRHFWNRPIPKLLDNRFSCWELVQECMNDLGKPIISKYDVVIIVDLLRAVKWS